MLSELIEGALAEFPHCEGWRETWKIFDEEMCWQLGETMLVCGRMRRIVFWATFPLLIAGLLVLWNYRYERTPTSTELRLADLRVAVPDMPSGAEWRGSAREPVLQLVVSPENPRVQVRVELPGIQPVEALWIRFRMKAKNLIVGEQEWDDGRVLIEWRSADGTVKLETDPVSSLRGNADSGEIELVVMPVEKQSIPVLCIEHRGQGGEFEISKLEMTPVRERTVWRFGKWMLVSAWVLWIWMFLRSVGNRSNWRNALVAVIWVLAGLLLSVPGPWKTQRPLMIPFNTGLSVTPVADDQLSAMVAKSDSAPPNFCLSEQITEGSGRIPIQGGWILQVKHYLFMLRPLLHAMLLMGPALLFASLVNRRATIILAMSLAVSIEAAQTAFGYGFGWDDVVDLATDAIGIALALWVWAERKKLLVMGCMLLGKRKTLSVLKV